jgi:hypothetical protein
LVETVPIRRTLRRSSASVSTITFDHNRESARSVATRFQRSLFAPRFVSVRDLQGMLPGSLGHLGVCAREVSFGELEIEHRLELGLVLGIDDLASLLLGGLPPD